MVEPYLAVLILGLLLILILSPARRAVVHLASYLASRYQDARLASRRAEALLREVLSSEEHARLLERGYLDVRSPSRPSRVYRIPRDGGIVVMRENGRSVGGLCVQSIEPIPVADTVAMHKLMIEGAEEDYLRQANHLSVGALSRYGLGVLYER